MKYISALFLLCLCTHAYAEIFVCKDGNKTSYQDKQCGSNTIRKLDILPPPSPEEQAQAQERLQRIAEQSEQRKIAAELERQRQEKNDIELEKLAIERRKLELLEQQAAAEPTVTRWVYVRPWYNRLHRPHHTGDRHAPHEPNNRSSSQLTFNTK